MKGREGTELNGKIVAQFFQLLKMIEHQLFQGDVGQMLEKSLVDSLIELTQGAALGIAGTMADLIAIGELNASFEGLYNLCQ